MQNIFHMTDLGRQPVAQWCAAASGEIEVGETAFYMIQERTLPQGDALALAEVAGITGAKKAHEVNPLGRPLALDYVKLVTELNEVDYSITVTCFTAAHARSGVEMEALAGVQAALLALWEMTKAVEPELCIHNVKVLATSGGRGKGSVWQHSEGVPDWVMEIIHPVPERVLAGRRAIVLTVSDHAFGGECEDKTGVWLQDMLMDAGALLVDYRVVPDEEEIISVQVQDLIGRHAPDLLLCVGGTGIAPRDVTPEALAELMTCTIPGIGELVRRSGADATPHSWSSRAAGGIIGSSLVISLPGNHAAVAAAMQALLPELIPHLLRSLQEEEHV